MFRVIAFIIGLALAAAGGVIAYRALFLEPSAAIVVTDTDVRELPNTVRATGGIIMLVGGMALAFFAARHKPM
jgi:multidrug efflux pump subunit AcrA (membrane-fusion protein)